MGALLQTLVRHPPGACTFWRNGWLPQPLTFACQLKRYTSTAGEEPATDDGLRSMAFGSHVDIARWRLDKLAVHAYRNGRALDTMRTRSQHPPRQSATPSGRAQQA
eukprot:scaffold30733_cov129-Isochrysis_galbana.AAC.2